LKIAQRRNPNILGIETIYKADRTKAKSRDGAALGAFGSAISHSSRAKLTKVYMNSLPYNAGKNPNSINNEMMIPKLHGDYVRLD